MLEQLKIENLLLVKSAVIPFQEGLNILTGETGSGKSAILFALKLALGEKADSSLIRTGASMALVEAKLRRTELLQLPEEFDNDLKTPLIIRREIYASGKSRAFINDQLTSLSLLKTILASSFELIDQDSSHLIKHRSNQLKLLDMWADVDSLELSSAYTSFHKSLLELTAVEEQVAKKRILFLKIQEELKEIEDVKFKENEEQTLSEEHEKLSKAEEKIKLLYSLQEQLYEGESPLSFTLGRLSSSLEPFADCKDAKDLLKTASLEIHEASCLLSRILSTTYADPKKLATIEERIGVLERLKRKFGDNYHAIEKARLQRKQELFELENPETLLLQLKESVSQKEHSLRTLAYVASCKRKEATLHLEKKVEELLFLLNLLYAKISIRWNDCAMSAHGTEEVRFFFRANPGQEPSPLEDSASGGEMARLLFALKLLLAEKEKKSCLIFDEIDSNIGGQTAKVLGEMLQHLSKNKQVICITHFVQVAKCASHHLLIKKTQTKSESTTNVHTLKHLEKEQEYARMIGQEA